MSSKTTTSVVALGLQSIYLIRMHRMETTHPLSSRMRKYTNCAFADSTNVFASSSLLVRKANQGERGPF